MTMPDGNTLGRLFRSLDGSASQIEQTFAVAGDQLGQGLAVFETLKDTFGALSQELRGPELQTARDALYRLATELDALRSNLPGETATLSSIASESALANHTLERLLESMRLITILARSARIEAASVQAGAEAFGDFANEIVGLAFTAQGTVDACARDHGGLDALLRSALGIQRDFEMRYRETLAKLAGDLRSTLTQVDIRQQDSIGRTQEAAMHSSNVMVAAGGAIMALQSGDAIRQRLEHALVVLRMAMGEMVPGMEACEPLSSSDRAFLTTVLSHLLKCQLNGTGETLEQDVFDIDRALLQLADDTAALMDLGLSLYGGNGASSVSFLQTLETELAQATDLLRKCQIARRGVERVTTALTHSFDKLDHTVATLGNVVDSIQLIGTNASLRAARLGQSGRSLVIIAQELKAVAADVAKDAARLTPIFTAMQKSGKYLDRRETEEIDLTAIDRTMGSSLDTIRMSGARLSITLSQLTTEGAAFAAVVGQARLMFSNAGATAEVIQGCAAILEHARSDTHAQIPDDLAAIQSIMRSVVRPTYTMVIEREIHDRVLSEIKSLAGEESIPIRENQMKDDLFEDLFL